MTTTAPLEPKPVLMRTNFDCGPVALANATGLPYETVMSVGWRGLFKGNDDDTSLHLQAALGHLGYGWTNKNLNDIAGCDFAPGKTVAMILADDSNPLSYHWFTLLHPTARGIAVYDGIKDRPVTILWPRFISGWGSLSKAMEIREPSVQPQSLRWYQQAWVWFTTRVLRFPTW